MPNDPSMKTILDPAREIKVCREADVVVVGGGPGGHSAAIAAARNGADTVLIERYGHLGGQSTGGLVTLMRMSGGEKAVEFGGICLEWIKRLDAAPRGSVLRTKDEDIGSSDPAVVKKYAQMGMMFLREGHVCFAASFDAEVLKCILSQMLEEAGVKQYLHSWGTRAIVEKGQVKGVVFESKSGTQAILGKVVIDGTGDGDLFPSAGVEFDDKVDSLLRNSKLSLVFEIGNVDVKKYEEFKATRQDHYSEQISELGWLGATLEN